MKKKKSRTAENPLHRVNIKYREKQEDPEVRNLLLFLFQLAERMVKRYESDDDDFFIDTARLHHLIISFRYDIIRNSEFHDLDDEDGSHGLNAPKQVAYLVKWILKCKPICYIKEELEFDPSKKEYHSAVACNEAFAVCVISALLERKLDQHRCMDLIYNFAFRDFNTGLFELLCESYINDAEKW